MCVALRLLSNDTRFMCFWLGHEMDVRDMSFESGSFDVAIDKGTRRCPDCFAPTPTNVQFRDYGRHDDSQGRRLGR